MAKNAGSAARMGCPETDCEGLVHRHAGRRDLVRGHRGEAPRLEAALIERSKECTEEINNLREIEAEALRARYRSTAGARMELIGGELKSGSCRS
jgi:hypothetical protein